MMSAAADHDEVIPVFVVDPAFERAGVNRRSFLHDCLVGLDAAIRRRSDGGLVLRRGDPVDEIPRLAAESGASAVYASGDFGPYGRRRDEAVSDRLERDGGRLAVVGSPYAVTPGGVRKSDGSPYAVFTPFSKVWRAVGWELPIDHPSDGEVGWAGERVESVPLGPRPAPDGALPPAGEPGAHELWSDFLAHHLDDYDQRRDLPAADGTSRLSAALKWGTLHPRQLLAALDASGAGSRAHSVFSSELAWRDFYADILAEQPRTAWENLDRRMDSMPVDTDAAARRRFRRWTAGATGFGIVDAGMRQLAATGWMHNRVRMITASFLVKDLHLPWQWGARWFMTHLVDGDLASNNHGWQWAAGTGSDAAPYFRVFNPMTQAERYDPHGEYVARWAPDPLAPMLDHAEERREALARLATVTR